MTFTAGLIYKSTTTNCKLSGINDLNHYH